MKKIYKHAEQNMQMNNQKYALQKISQARYGKLTLENN